MTVEEVAEESFATWLDTVVSGFMTPDADGIPSHESFPREVLEEVVGDMARAPQLHRYLARRGGRPAGAASVHFHDNIARLSGSSTLPAHRRRGVQAGLLAHRLSNALRAGCDVAVVTTQPGSTSQRNVQRKGFELLYARAVFVLDPPGG
jgi:GNAT superfamily N-acetyltransferase